MIVVIVAVGIDRSAYRNYKAAAEEAEKIETTLQLLEYNYETNLSEPWTEEQQLRVDELLANIDKYL